MESNDIYLAKLSRIDSTLIKCITRASSVEAAKEKIIEAITKVENSEFTSKVILKDRVLSLIRVESISFDLDYINIPDEIVPDTGLLAISSKDFYETRVDDSYSVNKVIEKVKELSSIGEDLIVFYVEIEKIGTDFDKYLFYDNFDKECLSEHTGVLCQCGHEFVYERELGYEYFCPYCDTNYC